MTEQSNRASQLPGDSEPTFTLTQVQRLVEDIAARVQGNHDSNHFDTVIVSTPDGHLIDAKSWRCAKCLEAVDIVRATSIEDFTG